MPFAQFQPGQAPGAISGALNAGISTGLSIRDRNEVSKQRESMLKSEELNRKATRQDMKTQELQNIERQVMAPVTKAKAESDLIEISTRLDGMERAERSRGVVHEAMPEIREAFDTMLSMGNLDDREMLALEWMATSSQWENVTEYSEEFAAKKEIAAKIIQEARAIRELGEKSRLDKEEINERTKGSIAVAEARASAPAKNEFLSLMRELNRAKESGDTESADFFEARINKLTYVTPQRREKIENLMFLEETARAAGDTAKADIYAAAIEKESTRSVDPLRQSIADSIAGNNTPPAEREKPAPPPAEEPKPQKLYQIEGDQVFIPAGLSDEKLLETVQQALDDGIMTEEDAGQILLERGFTSNK